MNSRRSSPASKKTQSSRLSLGARVIGVASSVDGDAQVPERLR